MTGTLPVNRGGTGVTSINAIRGALGIFTLADYCYMGGQNWRCIHKGSGFAILKCMDSMSRAYKSSGSCGRWSTSDLRTYLNGEFYNKFSAAEKQRIIPVSNGQVYANDNYTHAGVETTNDNVWIECYQNLTGVSYSSGGTFNEYTTVLGTKISSKFLLYVRAQSNQTIGAAYWLRSGGGYTYNLICPASGTSMNLGANGSFSGCNSNLRFCPCIAVLC